MKNIGSIFMSRITVIWHRIQAEQQVKAQVAYKFNVNPAGVVRGLVAAQTLLYE